MRNYLRIGTSSKTCRCYTELRNVFHAIPFSDFLIISSFLTNHCVTALFNVCFSLLCHGLCFSWRIFCLWIAWKCYCRSFLWKNLAKKAKTTKMLFHKHKMSSLVTLSKEFEIQAQYLYCKWQLSSSGFCCQNKHVFSKHKQTSFFSCAVPIVPIGSPSECRQIHLPGSLACKHHHAIAEFWLMAVCSNKKKTLLVWKSSVCVMKAISVSAASWAECKPTSVTLFRYNFVKGSKKHDFQAVCEDELK